MFEAIVAIAGQFPIGLINRSKQLTEAWRVIDRPSAGERRPKNLQIAARQQSDSNDTTTIHDQFDSCLSIRRRTNRTDGKCPAFRDCIGRRFATNG